MKGRYNIDVGKTASMSMLTLFEYTLKGRYNIDVGKTASTSIIFESRFNNYKPVKVS